MTSTSPLLLGLLCVCVECASLAHDRAQPSVRPACGPNAATAPPRLTLHRRDPGGIHPLAPGSLVQAGDVVQVSYDAAGFACGVILSLDGEGHVTLHHPLDAHQPAPLESGGRALDHAFQLDDAAHFERFLFVASHDASIDLPSVLGAAAALSGTSVAATAPLPLPSRWAQSSFLLRKSP